MKKIKKNANFSHPILADVYAGQSHDWVDAQGNAIGATQVLANLFGNYKLPSPAIMAWQACRLLPEEDTVTLDDEAYRTFTLTKKLFDELAKRPQDVCTNSFLDILLLFSGEDRKTANVGMLLEALLASFYACCTVNPTTERILQQTVAEIIRCYRSPNTWELAEEIFADAQHLYDFEERCGNDTSEFFAEFEEHITSD